jgi:hypothetical protein
MLKVVPIRRRQMRHDQLFGSTGAQMMHGSTHQQIDADGNQPAGRRRTWQIAAIMIALVLVFLLVREHWEHVAGPWLYLLLLACPLMHLFGHGGHGKH